MILSQSLNERWYQIQLKKISLSEIGKILSGTHTIDGDEI